MNAPFDLGPEPGATPLESLMQFQDYHWLMLKVFAEAIDRDLGREHIALFRDAGVEVGRFRGLSMHDASDTIVRGRGVTQLLEGWDGAEWDLQSRAGLITIHADEDGVALELPGAPGHSYLEPLLGVELATAVLAAYWSGFAEGMALEYTEARMSIGDASHGGWIARFDGPVISAPVLGDRLENPVTLLEVNRRTTGLLATLQLAFSRALVDRFDASGEETVRRAAYRFGADRGEVIRERMVAQGKPLTLANFGSKDGLQERDPGEAVFVYRDRQHLSDGAYYIDCTYCPLAEIWKGQGEKSLKLAYLFDASNHRGLFQSYNPATQVRWHSVKSRGDAVCRFRFTIPELMDENDPTPEEFDAADPLR